MNGLVVQTTPFHARTSVRNETGLWVHWAGYLAVDRYQMSSKREYYAVRVAAGLLDTSPLYKYRITGADAERFLGRVLVRDVRRCRPGRGQYTMWCDDRGFVVEDGVVLRTGGDEFLLTAAEPNLAYLTGLVAGERVEIDDVSAGYGILALQGPRAAEILGEAAGSSASLPRFEVAADRIAHAPVLISATGYTGGPGYEVWVEPDEALAVWDALCAAGHGRGLQPFGSQVLHMARIEAGLLLIDVDYRSSRYAWTDEQRATPVELGYGWMLDEGEDRAFRGRDALESAAPRWKLVGVTVDWHEYQRVHDEAGQPAPEDHRPVAAAMSIYDGDGVPVGFSTSFMYSPLLKRHIGMARVPLRLAEPGSEVGIEILIDHRPVTVRARVCRLPFHAR